MSFDVKSFTPIGGQTRRGKSPTHWAYKSFTDDLETVLALGYFNEVGTRVLPGDFIDVFLLDGKAIITVASTFLRPPTVVIDSDVISPNGDGGSSSTGARGATGAKGADGSDGPSGPAGSDGSDGARGATGAKGADGKEGAQGLRGPAGSDGSDGSDGARGADGKDGVDGGSFPKIKFTGRTKNLVVSDNEKFWVMDNELSQTINIPSNASQPFPVGAEMDFLRKGSGTVSFSSSTTVKIISREDLKNISTKNSGATLKKIDTDEWSLLGALA
jgi:hypothetical protein